LAGAEALLNASGVRYEREIASGEPAPALIDMAHRHGCDAIIMGARGRGALRSALLGSVSQHVVQNAAVPVTIVKHGGAEFAQTDGLARRVGAIATATIDGPSLSQWGTGASAGVRTAPPPRKGGSLECRDHQPGKATADAQLNAIALPRRR
jgi:hypothetical protein